MGSSRLETRDERAERLAPIAAEFAARLRDEDVDDLAVELLDPLPRRDLYALIGLLGGAAPVDQPASAWWAWMRHRAALRAAPDLVETEDDDPETQIIDRIRYLATVTKMSDAAIADRVGMSHSAVTRRRERAGIPAAVPHGRRKPPEQEAA